MFSLEEKLTFEQMPEVLSSVLDELKELRAQVALLTPQSEVASHRLIDIDEVSHITGKAKATIYSMVCRREIPCCKRGKRLYFYEDEIMRWIEQGRKLTSGQIMDSTRRRR